jgi:hypothetical protein
MASDKADMIRLLEAELDFIEGGGYGKPAGKPNEEKPIFHHSPACINSWSVPGHDAECHDDCVLLDAVPHGNRQESLPCHFIPLNEAGDTLESLEGKADQEQLEETVKEYLRNEIKRLREEGDVPGQPGVKY